MNLGLFGLTFPIILMYYPVAHGFVNPFVVQQILNVVVNNRNLLATLINQGNNIQNAIAQLRAIPPAAYDNNALNAINTRLSNMETSVNAIKSQMESSSTKVGETLSRLENSITLISSTLTTNKTAISDLLIKIVSRLDNIEKILDRMEKNCEVYIDQDSLRTVNPDTAADEQGAETNKLLQKYGQKLDTYNDNVNAVTNNLIELKRQLDRIGEASHNNMSEDPTELNDKLYELKNILIATNGSIHSGLDHVMANSERAHNETLPLLSVLNLEVQHLSGNNSMKLQSQSNTDRNKAGLLEIKGLLKEQIQRLNDSVQGTPPLLVSDRFGALSEKLQKLDSDLDSISSDMTDIYNELSTNNENKNKTREDDYLRPTV